MGCFFFCSVYIEKCDNDGYFGIIASCDLELGFYSKLYD